MKEPGAQQIIDAMLDKMMETYIYAPRLMVFAKGDEIIWSEISDADFWLSE